MHYVGILDGKGRTWGVRIPDLPGCYGAGSSPDAAIADAVAAARVWIEDRQRDGIAIRKPRSILVIRRDATVEFDPATEIMVLITVPELHLA